MFEDEYRWTNWLAGISTDLVKIAIAGAAGYLASAFVAGVFSAGVIAVAPLVVGVVVAIAIGRTLTAIDEHYQITQRLAHYLEVKEAEVKLKASNKFYDGVYYVMRSVAQTARRQLSQAATRKINELTRFTPRLWN